MGPAGIDSARRSACTPWPADRPAGCDRRFPPESSALAGARPTDGPGRRGNTRHLRSTPRRWLAAHPAGAGCSSASGLACRSCKFQHVWFHGHGSNAPYRQQPVAGIHRLGAGHADQPAQFRPGARAQNNSSTERTWARRSSARRSTCLITGPGELISTTRRTDSGRRRASSSDKAAVGIPPPAPHQLARFDQGNPVHRPGHPGSVAPARGSRQSQAGQEDRGIARPARSCCVASAKGHCRQNVDQQWQGRDQTR